MIGLGGVSKDRSHTALVIGENPLGITTAEEPSRQGAGRFGIGVGRNAAAGVDADLAFDTVIAAAFGAGRKQAPMNLTV